MNAARKTMPPLSSAADILAEVRISDAPEVMRLNKLAPEVQAEIVQARLAGYSPVSLRWPGGQIAIVFCEHGESWPKPENIISAYRRCLQTSTCFPAGELSCQL